MAALRMGHWNLLRLKDIDGENSLQFGYDALEIVCAKGSWELYQWICTRPALLPASTVPAGYHTKAIDAAAKAGHKEIICDLHHHRGAICSAAAVVGAAQQGRLDILKWIRESHSDNGDYGIFWESPDAVDKAAENGHLACVEFLTKLGAPCTTLGMDYAAANGHLDVVSWLHNNREEGATPLAISLAARGGHLAVCQFLHEHRMDGHTPSALMDAIKAGSTEVVDWWRENRKDVRPPRGINL